MQLNSKFLSSFSRPLTDLRMPRSDIYMYVRLGIKIDNKRCTYMDMSMYLRHGIPYGIMMWEEKCPIVYFKPWASYFLYWQKALAEVGRKLKLITEKIQSDRTSFIYVYQFASTTYTSRIVHTSLLCPTSSKKKEITAKRSKGKEEPETIKVKAKAKTKQSWTERKKVDGAMYVCVTFHSDS